jgi:hypothetical protein
MLSAVENVQLAFRDMLEQEVEDEAVVKLLLSLHPKVDLSVDDRGWLLWNICDRYAMLRDAEHQYKYQSEFQEWSKTNLSSYRLHWVVSDANQALTLTYGGFSEFWWDLSC